jgi:putative DNA primase/helicase
MDVKHLPDQPRPGIERTLPTIANVAALMDEAGIKARYNVIKKNVEVTVPGHTGSPDNLDNVTLTTIVSLCAQHMMPIGHIGEYVNAVADRNSYNPVEQWIDSRPWDGEDRFDALGGTMLLEAEYPEQLRDLLIRRWFRSAAAATIVSNYRGRGVLTLQGPQGIGKTSWIGSLIDDVALRNSVMKLDHHLDGHNKDSVLGAVCHWIVEIGELDSTFRRDIARIKGFLTADSDRVRRPYDRRESVYPRRTVFTATVNEGQFLVDTTGNSRWWTIAVRGLHVEHGIDMQQVFAQAAAEVRGGEPWWLSQAEERELEEWNGRHVAASVVEDLVMGILHLDAPPSMPRTYVVPSQLLKAAGMMNPSNAQAKECGAILRKMYGGPKRVNGREVWKVPIKIPNGNEMGGVAAKAAKDEEVY